MVDYKAIIQAVDYIINKQSNDSNSLDNMTILKLLFFAERYSLRKYAQSITNDKFVAMKNGPVASKTYDILRFNQFVKQEYRDYLDNALQKDGITNVISLYKFKNREDYTNLSDTDIESLDFSINTFGMYSPKKLSDISHNYPEWSKFQNHLSSTNLSYNMDFQDFFSKTTELTKEYDIIPEHIVQISKEIYYEDIFNR